MSVRQDLLEEWQLTPDGEPTGVAPVRTAGGRPAVLKLGAAEHEHLALQHWHGVGAVQLLRADPHRCALLLERLHPEDLTDLWDVEACEIVGGLYARLHVPAPPQLPAPVAAGTALDRGLSPTRRCRGGWSSRPSRSAATSPRTRRPTAGCCTPTCTTATCSPATASRGWRSHPKPLSGDPHYEVAPLLWNRWDELRPATYAGAYGLASTPRSTRRARRGPGARLGVVRTVLRAAAGPRTR